MKKSYFVFVIMFWALGINAQQNNVYTPFQYEQLKISGAIPVGNHTISYSLPDTTLYPESIRGGSSASCGCYIEPDGTYTLAMSPNDDGSTGLINIPFTFC